MGLTFLVPVFLLGLGALAVPILLHLLQREQREAMLFPSLMFLQRIPHRSVRRQRIKHWLLFLIRCLAVALIVLAFSRPFVEGVRTAAAELDGGRELVVVMDRSFSMRYGDRWERAVSSARAALDGLGPQDRASVIFFADDAQAASRPTADVAALRAAIDGTQPGAGGTRYGPPLRLAQRILQESELPRQEVVLITDFQRTGWEEDRDVVLPEGVVLTPVNVSMTSEPLNVAVTSVSLRRIFRAGRERVQVAARLINRGQAPLAGLEVSVELNGQPLQTESVDIDADNSATVTFTPFLVPEGISRGLVRAGQDPLPVDNVFHFVLSPGEAVSVLVLEHSSAGAEQSLYVRRALDIGNQPAFRVDVKPLAQFRLEDTNGRSVIILNDAPFPGGSAGARLKAFVEGGGGMLVGLGRRSGTRAWSGEGATLLPVSAGTEVRSPDRGSTLSYLDYGHPIFEPFSAPRSGDFSSARFFRYRVVNAPTAEGILARFDDGSIALAEKKIGEGRVLLWTSTLDRFWNDLALQPVFLPFVHQMARYLGGYVETRSWFTVGQVLDLTRLSELVGGGRVQAALEAGTDLVLEAPSGERIRLTATEDAGTPITIAEQGVYGFREPGVTGSPMAVVAVNLDPSESDLTSVDPLEFAGSVTAGTTAEDTEGSLPDGAELTVDEQEQRQRLWWYLLGSAMLLLAVETAVSNRLSRRPR
jgi:hypothetical protein